SPLKCPGESDVAGSATPEDRRILPWALHQTGVTDHRPHPPLSFSQADSLLPIELKEEVRAGLCNDPFGLSSNEEGRIAPPLRSLAKRRTPILLAGLED